MTQPLDNSSDTDKMSEDSGDPKQALESSGDNEIESADSGDLTPVFASDSGEHISFRYKEVRAQYLQTKENLEKVNAVEDNVSRDVFNTLLEDQQSQLDKLEPEVKSLEKQIKKRMLELSNDINQIVDETGNNARKIENYNNLYKAGIIDKTQRKQEVKAISQRTKELEAVQNDKNRELGLLKYALEETTVTVIKPPESVVSYTVKFLLFAAVMELSVLVFWFLFKGLDSDLLSLSGTIPYFHSALQVIIFVGVLFLFTGTRARSVSYFITAGIFILISLFIFTNLQVQNLKICEPEKVLKSDTETPKEQEKAPTVAVADQADKKEAPAKAEVPKKQEPETVKEEVYYSNEMKKAVCLWDVKMADLNFSNYWAAVNLTIALFIFVVAAIRTFFNGLQYDYRK